MAREMPMYSVSCDATVKTCPFSKNEEKLLIELISNEQIHMIKKNHMAHDSEKYKLLEELKVKIKEM